MPLEHGHDARDVGPGIDDGGVSGELIAQYGAVALQNAYGEGLAEQRGGCVRRYGFADKREKAQA